MSNALRIGVSGLRAHQQQLDVVSNNLANMNTTGFKSQAVSFNDLMYETVRPGSGASANTGGTNPQQIGTGVEIGQISRSFGQGALVSTGELFDFAIQGNGFFVLDGDSSGQLFSRAGSFSLDERGNLVDPATGFLVQRTGSLGESLDDEFGFQTPGDESINVPLGSLIPGVETQSVDFSGNLPAQASPPTAEVLTSAEAFETSSGPAESATSLNDFLLNIVDYEDGDEIELSGTNPDGSSFATTIDASNATMEDIVNALNGLLTSASAALNPNGSLEITANNTGEAFASLTIQDASGNVGMTEFEKASMVVSNEGSDGDTFDVSVEVFDARGDDHRMVFQFRKESDNGWSLLASVEDDSGELLDSQVHNIFFDEDGTFSLAGNNGEGDSNIEIQFESLQGSQSMELSFDRISHHTSDYNASVLQDGAPTGTLVSVAVDSGGKLNGLASNGRVFELAQLAIARFANDGGLESIGGNFFRESLNSGTASVGAGLSEGRGQVIGNQLESSNVDLAEEFTRLIVAQRGFSANARTITVADEILEEMTNLIR